MEKIKSLQTLRLFASLGVVNYHLWSNYLGVSIAHPGTDIFLVLVGFIAAVSQANSIGVQDWATYISRRYVRLYVAYIPLFLIAMIFKWSKVTPYWALHSFFFLPLPDREPVIADTWMMSMFMVFYWLYSLTFLFKRESILWPIFGLWAAGIVSYSWVGWGKVPYEHWLRLLFDERNLDFIFGYLAGMLMREQRITIQWARIALLVGAAGLVGGTVLLNLTSSETGRSLYLGIPVMLLCLGIACLERQKADSRIVRIMTQPSLAWLGGITYVLYLIHGMFFDAWSKLLRLPVTPALVPLMILGAVAVAAIVYVSWERPLLSYMMQRRGLLRKTPMPSTQGLL